jgi:hypothetical protein
MGFIGLLKHLITGNYSALANLHTLQFVKVRAKSSIVFTSRCLSTDPNNALSFCAHVVAG